MCHKIIILFFRVNFSIFLRSESWEFFHIFFSRDDDKKNEHKKAQTMIFFL